MLKNNRKLTLLNDDLGYEDFSDEPHWEEFEELCDEFDRIQWVKEKIFRDEFYYRNLYTRNMRK